MNRSSQTILTPQLLDQYERDGFAVLPSVFGAAQVEPLLEAVGQDPLAVVDGAGNRQQLNTWTYCGDDLVGRFPRIDPIVALAEFVIGGPVYHWHSKLSWKQPGSTGTWDWHQDYGFWVEEGCASPTMTTVSVALDHHDRSNGCLRVIRGSHHRGVIEHPPVGASRSADPDILSALLADSEVVDVELSPGDVVVFHCNTLHASGPNSSDRPRTLLHCSYNAVANAATEPLIVGHEFNRLDRLPATAIQPGAWPQVSGLTHFIGPDETGYTGRNGYQVEAGG